jgi:aspartate carbamoyltransferase catalytic subunit
LAADALRIVDQQSPSAWKALESKPDDRAAYLRALYSALALRNGKVPKSLDLTEAEKSLTRQAKGSPLEVERVVAAALLKPSPETESAFATAVASQRLVGDDLVVLASVAAKNRGGTLWKTFREEMPAVVAKQPLNANVRLLVNRLETAKLAARTD